MSELSERENGINGEYRVGRVNEDKDRLIDGTIGSLVDGKRESSFGLALARAKELMDYEHSGSEVVIVSGRALERISDDSPSIDISWSSKDSYHLQKYLENSVEEWNTKNHILGVKSDAPSVYFDIDGTTGKWYADGQRADGRKFEALEEIIDPANHYFRDIEPHKFMIDVASALNDKGYDVCSLSAADRNTIRDKWDWVHENMPFIKDENIFFSPLGADKSSFVKGNAEISVLIDDYKNNLDAWKGQSIKAINTVNSHQDKYPEIDMTQPEKMWEEYQTLKASLEDEKALEQAFDSVTLMYAKAVEAAVETIESSIKVIEREYAEELSKTFEERRGLLRFDEFKEYSYEQNGLKASGWEYNFKNAEGRDVSAVVIKNADSALEAAVPVVKVSVDGSEHFRIYQALSREGMASNEIDATLKQAYEAFKKCPHLTFIERDRISDTLDLAERNVNERTVKGGVGYTEAFKKVNKEQLDARYDEWKKGFNAMAQYYAVNLHDTIAAGKTEANFTERELDTLNTLKAMYKDYQHQDETFSIADWELNYSIERGGAGRDAYIADEICKQINSFVHLMEDGESEAIAELYKGEIAKAIQSECEKCNISPADMRKIIDESGLSREKEIPEIIDKIAKSNPTYLLSEEEDKELTQLLTKLERNGKNLSDEEARTTVDRVAELLEKGNEGNVADRDALMAMTDTITRHVDSLSEVRICTEEILETELKISEPETIKNLVEKSGILEKTEYNMSDVDKAWAEINENAHFEATIHEGGEVELAVRLGGVSATVPLPFSEQTSILNAVEAQLGEPVRDYFIDNRAEQNVDVPLEILNHLKSAANELEEQPENGEYFGYDLHKIEEALKDEKGTTALIDKLYEIDERFGTDPMYFGVEPAPLMEQFLKDNGYGLNYDRDTQLYPAIKERAEALIKQEIKDNPDGYQLYFAYDEKIDEETFKEILQEYEEHLETCKKEGYEPSRLEDFIYEQIDEKWQLWDRTYDEYDQNFYNNLSDEDKEAIDTYLHEEQISSLSEAFDNMGFNGVSFDINDIIGDYKVNIMLATEWELNTDLNAIHNMTELLHEEPKEMIKSLDNEQNINHGKYFDNGLAYLIEQQGHTMSEVINAMNDKVEIPKEGFLKDIVDELNEYNSGKQLAALIRVSSMDDIRALEQMMKETPDTNITIKKESNLILHDEFSGRCGDLISLDKDFTFPTSMYHKLEIEGTRRDDYHYTVDQTAGFVGSVWKGDVSVDKTDFDPSKIKVDVSKVKETVKELEKGEKKRDVKERE